MICLHSPTFLYPLRSTSLFSSSRSLLESYSLLYSLFCKSSIWTLLGLCTCCSFLPGQLFPESKVLRARFKSPVKCHLITGTSLTNYWKSTVLMFCPFTMLDLSSWNFPGGTGTPLSMQETWDSGSLSGWEYPLEKEMVTHSSIVAWKIPWTKEPDGLHGVTKSWTRLSTWNISVFMALITIRQICILYVYMCVCVCVFKY